MAQRKSPSPTSKKPGARPAPAKGANGRTAAGPTAASGGRPPTRKPGKSIVNQKQTPWGLIAVAIVLVLFAGAIIAVAVSRSSGSSGSGSSKVSAENKPYVQPETAAAKKIQGIIYKPEINHKHVVGTVRYNTSPPTGGDHSQVWASCQGTVYGHQIANENAVHMLEHGAVWITYNPKTATATDVSRLKTLVDGVDRMALSPYAGLRTPISLQAWDYQLFVTEASDPRVSAFIDALKYNSKTTPELGATCQATSAWNANKSTPGHPID